ncbi:hypothetical protein [Frankia sp. CcWB3]
MSIRSRLSRHPGVLVLVLLAMSAVLVATLGHEHRGHNDSSPDGSSNPDRPGPTSAASLPGLPVARTPHDAHGPLADGDPRPGPWRRELAAGIRPVPATQPGKLRFGLGPALDSALASPLAGDLDFLTTWYNGPGDLSFLRKWRADLIPEVYHSGHGIHLVVWLDGTGSVGTFQTSHGPACGREYPLSGAFLADARELASIFAGPANGPALYVTLFTELQTYPCQSNEWAATPETTNYYRALQDRYLATQEIFHAGAPNARVSLGWGGWQSRWDDPVKGGGRSLITHFADVLRASDFQSFQAMGNDSNAADVRNMTKLLGQYGPVMVAHFKSGSQAVWDADMHALLAGDEARKLSLDGLFAFSFMDQSNIIFSPRALATARGGGAEPRRPVLVLTDRLERSVSKRAERVVGRTTRQPWPAPAARDDHAMRRRRPRGCVCPQPGPSCACRAPSWGRWSSRFSPIRFSPMPGPGGVRLRSPVPPHSGPPRPAPSITTASITRSPAPRRPANRGRRPAPTASSVSGSVGSPGRPANPVAGRWNEYWRISPGWRGPGSTSRCNVS